MAFKRLQRIQDSKIKIAGRREQTKEIVEMVLMQEGIERNEKKEEMVTEEDHHLMKEDHSEVVVIEDKKKEQEEEEEAREVKEEVEEVVKMKIGYQKTQLKLKKFSMNNLLPFRRSKVLMSNMTRKNQIKWTINSKHS